VSIFFSLQSKHVRTQRVVWMFSPALPSQPRYSSYSDHCCTEFLPVILLHGPRDLVNAGAAFKLLLPTESVDLLMPPHTRAHSVGVHMGMGNG
jgi:hypothetical protein